MGFIDAQKMKKQNPNTFYAPTKKELDKLKKGDIVKVCYNNLERFWAIIDSIKSDKINAIIDNDLIHDFDFNYGDKIQFEKKNIYSIF